MAMTDHFDHRLCMAESVLTDEDQLTILRSVGMGESVIVFPLYRYAIPNTPPVLLHVPWRKVTERDLTLAQANLTRGFKVLFTTAAYDPQKAPTQEETPNTTPTEVTGKSDIPVNEAIPTEKDYWNLRTAIRQAILRHPEYKVEDTAKIAEDMRTGKISMAEATERFQKLLQTVFYAGQDQARNEERNAARERENVLREQMRKDLVDLGHTIHKATLKTYHQGGVVRVGELATCTVTIRNTATASR